MGKVERFVNILTLPLFVAVAGFWLGILVTFGLDWTTVSGLVFVPLFTHMTLKTLDKVRE